MGQTLGAPVTIKDCGDGYDEKKSIAWGFSCMQGWRPTMEATPAPMPDRFALCHSKGDARQVHLPHTSSPGRAKRGCSGCYAAVGGWGRCTFFCSPAKRGSIRYWRRRSGMVQDAHFALGSLEGEWTDTAAFGVMDGHGGTQVALFCQRHLPAEISRGASRDPHSALIAAFHKMDDMLWETGETDLQAFTDASASRPGGRGGRSADPKWMGCTAVVCLVRP
ncbi:unnamed protein product, partial [Prorocentrum cordatum]